MVHKGILCSSEQTYLYTTLSYAANLSLYGQCGWHQLINFIRPYSYAAFDMNCMVNSPHSEYGEYCPVTRKPVN